MGLERRGNMIYALKRVSFGFVDQRGKAGRGAWAKMDRQEFVFSI